MWNKPFKQQSFTCYYYRNAVKLTHKKTYSDYTLSQQAIPACTWSVRFRAQKKLTKPTHTQLTHRQLQSLRYLRHELHAAPLHSWTNQCTIKTQAERMTLVQSNTLGNNIQWTWNKQQSEIIKLSKEIIAQQVIFLAKLHKRNNRCSAAASLINRSSMI
jgi:hypothetical protein